MLSRRTAKTAATIAQRGQNKGAPPAGPFGGSELSSATALIFWARHRGGKPCGSSTGEIGTTFRCSDALMHLLLRLPINLLSRGSRSAGQIVTRHQQADPQSTTCNHSPKAGKEKCRLSPGILVAIIIRHFANPSETTPHSLLLLSRRVNHVTVSWRKDADKVLHASLTLNSDLNGIGTIL